MSARALSVDLICTSAVRTTNKSMTVLWHGLTGDLCNHLETSITLKASFFNK